MSNTPIVKRIDDLLETHSKGQSDVPVLFADRVWLLCVRKPGDKKWRFTGSDGKTTSRPSAKTYVGDEAHAVLAKARAANPGLEFVLESGAAVWMLWIKFVDNNLPIKAESGSLSAMKQAAEQRRKYDKTSRLAIVPKGMNPGSDWY